MLLPPTKTRKKKKNNYISRKIALGNLQRELRRLQHKNRVEHKTKNGHIEKSRNYFLYCNIPKSSTALYQERSLQLQSLVMREKENKRNSAGLDTALDNCNFCHWGLLQSLPRPSPAEEAAWNPHCTSPGEGATAPVEFRKKVLLALPLVKEMLSPTSLSQAEARAAAPTERERAAAMIHGCPESFLPCS